MNTPVRTQADQMVPGTPVAPWANEAFLSGITDHALPLTDGLLMPAFSAALILDLALESDSLENLCNKYKITPLDLQSLLDNAAFYKAVTDMKSEIGERGVSFKLKAAIQADMYLQDIHKMVSDATTPASVKLDAIKSVVKWADLEPKQKDTAGGGSAFKLVINMPGNSSVVQPAITVEG